METRISLLIAAGIGSILTGVVMSFVPTIGAAAFGCLIGAVLGSIYPDADIASSIICDSVYSDGQDDSPYVYVGGLGHGKFTHTLPAVLLASVPAWILGLILLNYSTGFGYCFLCVGGSMIIGGLIHMLIGTMFDPDGIMWLWPLTHKRISIVKTSNANVLKTATAIAIIIFVICGIVGGVMVVNALESLGLTTFDAAMSQLGI